MITHVDVFDYIYDEVIAVYPKAYITSTYQVAPEQFPCVMVRPINRTRPTDAMNLAYDDTQRRLTYEVQVISKKKNKAQTEAWDVMEKVLGGFKELYFIEDMLEPLEEDASNYRLVARLHRQIGGGETV